MPRVIVGYGPYRGYRPEELPSESLHQLAAQYPLELKATSTPDAHLLMITVAVHAELDRRRKGAGAAKRAPSLREVALDIVDRGYRQASKQITFGRHGSEEKKLRLDQAREFLLQSITRSADSAEDDGVIEIPEPQERWDEISHEAQVLDEDIPF